MKYSVAVLGNMQTGNAFAGLGNVRKLCVSVYGLPTQLLVLLGSFCVLMLSTSVVINRIPLCRTEHDVLIVHRTFAQNCRNIEQLNLNGCTKITDSTCVSLSKFCSKLRHLDLTSCVSITNHALKALR